MNYLLLLSVILSIVLTQIFYYYRFKKVEAKIENALENKVGEVLDTFKQEIPMASTFLRGSLEQKLKAKALSVVKKIIPDLKNQAYDYTLVAYPLLIGLAVTLAAKLLEFNFK